MRPVVRRGRSYREAGETAEERPGQSNRRERRVSWCTTTLVERKKCLDWARAIEEVNIQFEGQEPFAMNLDCAQGADKDQCMSMIDDERSDLILVDPGEIGLAGRYHSLTPIMVERYGGGGGRLTDIGHFSVAVVRKRSGASIEQLSDLFGKRACFSGVSHMASWTLPLAALIDLPQFEVADCNNLVKSASYFFANSCAPNALSSKFNPTGDNPERMSHLCEDNSRGSGNLAEPYRGAFSALKCLAEQPLSLGGFLESSGGRRAAADVAFLPHNTIFLAERLQLSREARLQVPSRADLELLCPQGGRAPLDRWASCNFGFVPAHAVVLSSRTSPERRQAIQRFLKTSVQLFAGLSSSVAPLASSVAFGQQQQQQVTLSGPTPGLSGRPRDLQQQSMSPFDFGLPADQFQSQSQAPSRDQFGTFGAANFPSAGTQRTPFNGQQSPPRINSNFRLTGDAALANYAGLDLLFSSDMVDLVPLEGAAQTFKGFLGSFPVQPASSAGVNRRPVGLEQTEIGTQLDYFEKLRRCPVPAAVLCVTSDREFNKCQAMSKAFHAAGLKPELNCKQAQSALACMQLLRSRDADLLVLDAADIYLAGSKFGLIPIVAEQIEMYDPNHYAIAVAKKSDQSTDLFNLRGRLSCHSAYLRAAGWIMPINFLLTNERIRRYDDCNSARSAAEHFNKACAPGILSSLSNIGNSSSSWTIKNMCDLCHGTGKGYCARDASEPFFGDTGAFRCLVEGGGQVAFMKHTAIYENTGGSNRETWARNLIKSDFELLCRDGSRASINDYKLCNLGKIPPSAIVTRGDTPIALADAYINLFMYGQQYYGSKYSEEYTFKMFSSTRGKDLIFQDATQQLARVPLHKQNYRSYLDQEFIRAMETVFCG